MRWPWPFRKKPRRDLRTVKEVGREAPAILFVHGFGGDSAKTWGQFPDLLAGIPELQGWSIHTLGYSTRLAPDFRGLWSGRPDIPLLARYLRGLADHDPSLKDAGSLTLIAHSMGGLVVQKTLVDAARSSSPLLHRIGHVFLFGTPSEGLRKATLAGLWGRQVGDMGHRSPFIRDLRRDWDHHFGAGTPFSLQVFAGLNDEFVGARSSLAPFPEELVGALPGNHLQIVKPRDASDPGVRWVRDKLLGRAAPAGPWNSAAVAVELGQFKRAIHQLEPHAAELDPPHLVQLALALEMEDRSDEALAILERYGRRAGTDALGVLAGRLKRRWRLEGRRSDAEKALGLYQEAYLQAAAAEHHEQAYYHAINVAYMSFVFAERDVADRRRTREMAGKALEHCRQAPDNPAFRFWRLATVAEAQLYLGDLDSALAAYGEALRVADSPREIESAHAQAASIATWIGDRRLRRRIEHVFRKRPLDLPET